MFLASSASRAQHARQAGSKAGLHTAAAAAPQASRDMTCMRGGDDDDARKMMATCMHDRERERHRQPDGKRERETGGGDDSFGGQVTAFHDSYTSLPPSRELKSRLDNHCHSPLPHSLTHTDRQTCREKERVIDWLIEGKLKDIRGIQCRQAPNSTGILNNPGQSVSQSVSQ